MIVAPMDVPVVREPEEGDGIVGRGGAPGQAEVQVVLRLQELPGLPIDLRATATQIEEMRERILPRMTRDPSCQPDSEDQAIEPIPGHGMERKPPNRFSSSGAPRASI
jgi:hypothetical protein